MIAMTLSGTIGPFVRESGQSAHNVVFFRCLFAALALAIYCQIKGYFRKEYFQFRSLALIFLVGVALVANWLFLFLAFQKTSITLAISSYYTQPFFLILLGAIFLKERLHFRKTLWILTAFGGLLFTLNPDASLLQGDSQVLVGIGYALLAALLYATVTLCARFLKGMPPALIALLQTTLGAILLFPFTSLEEVPLSGNHWFFLVSLGIIHTAFLYILFYKAVTLLPSIAVAILGFLDPIVAILSDYFLYSETLILSQLFGIFLILVSGLAISLDGRTAAKATTSQSSEEKAA